MTEPDIDLIAEQLAEISRQLEALPVRIGEATDRRTELEKKMAKMADEIGVVSPEEGRRLDAERERDEWVRGQSAEASKRANIALVVAALSALGAIAGVIVSLAT